VAIPVGSLIPGTLYHYRLVAKNEAGTTEGADRTFTTLSPPGPPSASTGAASALGETQATLNGMINPNGQATSFFFEWGTSSVYGQRTQELPAGEDHASHAESAALTGLTAGTAYHFRLVARNPSGSAPGTDQSFTTTSPLSPETTTPTTPPLTATQSSTMPAPATTAIVVPAPGPPIAGSPTLRATQHGTSVRGSLNVSPDGAGGRLEVALFAKGASIARGKAAPVLAGRFARSSVPVGRVSFAVKLNAKARSALMRHRSLALSVKMTLTPKGGPARSVTRAVRLVA